jgi:hypothetical protein
LLHAFVKGRSASDGTAPFHFYRISEFAEWTGFYLRDAKWISYNSFPGCA